MNENLGYVVPSVEDRQAHDNAVMYSAAAGLLLLGAAVGAVACPKHRAGGAGIGAAVSAAAMGTYAYGAQRGWFAFGFSK
jgi:hypothetical protein